jgi:glutamate/tyrosine decarboxylase-like PLP-dependent enzyme
MKQTIRLSDLIGNVVAKMEAQKATFGPFDTHISQKANIEQVNQVLDTLIERLDDNYPYFHPQYAAQMLKPPHPVARAAYVAAMMLNPNNHSIDGGRATTYMEREVMRDLASMFGYDPDNFLGHLTWSGTTANLEALWISREVNPGKAIAHSSDAHYVHSRMGEVLGVPTVAIPTDATGKMDLVALEERLREGYIGVVVATLGTTGLGAVDPLADIIPLARKYGARVHVDTAYGGFFILIPDALDAETNRHYAAIRDADSVVVDPHKHGLQPYGCGAVLFRDRTIGPYYKHDSPYTYFASEDLHYGEIQLETSRAGAAAAALWATLQVFPLTSDGLGAILRPGRQAAVAWYESILKSDTLIPYQKPELDIIAYLAKVPSMSKLDAVSHATFLNAIDCDRTQQTHLATYNVKPDLLKARGIEMDYDRESARIMRSVLMKPEQLALVPELHEHVEEWTRRSLNSTK